MLGRSGNNLKVDKDVEPKIISLIDWKDCKKSKWKSFKSQEDIWKLSVKLADEMGNESTAKWDKGTNLLLLRAMEIQTLNVFTAE